MNKTITIVYGGLKHFAKANSGKGKTMAKWFEFLDEQGSQMNHPYHITLGKEMSFDSNRKTTDSVPVGMVCEIEVEEDDQGTHYYFSELKRMEMITNQGWEGMTVNYHEGIDETSTTTPEEWLEFRRTMDASARQERSMKIAQNKLDKELGDDWMNMPVRDVCLYINGLDGVKKVNIMAIVLRRMGA